MKRFKILARALQAFPAWPDATAARLAELRRIELGARDPFRAPVGAGRVRFVARPLPDALVVCAGNVPEAGWQALARCALAEIPRVRLKLPSDAATASAIRAFAERLRADGLFESVECVAHPDEQDFASAACVLAFGSDETVAALRAKVPWHAPFLGYGHKISCGVVFDADLSDDLAARAAADVAARGQAGCLSPRWFFAVGGCGEAFAEALAPALDAVIGKARDTDVAGAAEVQAARADAVFRGARVWSPAGAPLWTVCLEADAKPRPAPAQCFVRVCPASSIEEVAAALQPIGRALSTVGMSTVRPFACAATRFCRIGEMHRPPVPWRHDGDLTLARMVRWVTVEEAACGG